MGDSEPSSLNEFVRLRLGHWPNPVSPEEQDLMNEAYWKQDRFDDALSEAFLKFWDVDVDSIMRGYELRANETTGASIYIDQVDADYKNPEQGIVVISEFDNREYERRVDIRRVLFNDSQPIWGSIDVCRKRDRDLRMHTNHVLNHDFFRPDVDPLPGKRDELLRFLNSITSWNETPVGYNLVMQTVMNKYTVTAIKYINMVTMPSGKIINTRVKRHTGRLVDELPFMSSPEAFDEFCYLHRTYSQRVANQAMRAIKLPPDIIDKVTEMSLGTISEASKKKRERINREAARGVVRNKRRAPAGENEPPLSRPRHQSETKEREIKDNHGGPREFEVRFVSKTDSHGRRWLHKYVNGQEVFEGLNWPQEQAPDEQVQNMAYIEWVAINTQRAAENLPPLPRPRSVPENYNTAHAAREEEFKLLRNQERETRRRTDAEIVRREYLERVAAERAARELHDAQIAQQIAQNIALAAAENAQANAGDIQHVDAEQQP